MVRRVWARTLCAAAMLIAVQMEAGAQQPGGSRSARALITQPVDSSKTFILTGHVRPDLTPQRDLGAVEDGLSIRLYMVLKRSPERQAELDNLIARQQQPTAAEYHKWVTPEQFGERFGVAQQDIQKITGWLESQGLRVNSVLNNASAIDFTATAGQIRTIFGTELHYYAIHGGQYAANGQDPKVPAAFADVVAGIRGLSKIPARSKRTEAHSFSYDGQTHKWQDHGAVSSGLADLIEPKYSDGQGNYLETPHDFYTIYDANKIYSGGNLALVRRYRCPSRPT